MSDLLAAVYAGDGGAVDRILAGEPELDVFEAAAVGRTERLRELLDGDPGIVSACSADGFTPLHLAAFFRHHGAARLLVDRGAPIDPVARHEQLRVTPLQSAVAAGEVATAALLLERGGNPNARQAGGFTPIHAAARNGDETMVDLLLACGADPGAATADGRTAAAFAREGGHVALAERLGALA